MFKIPEVRGSFIKEKWTDPNHWVLLGFLCIETDLYKYEINSANIHGKVRN